MSLIEAARTGSADVLGTLRRVASARGQGGLASRLAELSELVRWDMREIEGALAAVPKGADVVQSSAHHLLARGGKRLRPMCVAVAARCGSGFSSEARELALAVELVHCATLLHDDVVDLGEQRRGAPAARMLYGNAASIFAGDWLLVHALQRVRAAGVPGALERLLDIIDEMIAAEAIQLEHRGRVDTSEASYFKIVEGKTAALFRWATFAGARAGGLDGPSADALERYGLHLGNAFQLVDDLLDYAGEEEKTGKALFADLREGKMTYPVLFARERDASVLPLLEEIVASPDVPPPLGAALLAALDRSGALEATRALAQAHAERALAAIEGLPGGRAKDALHTVALATIERER
ncbi:MAG: polyprenyl synthetase family protein [Myxococcales bacterium]|nr:polyprenyl synthetase family protein [Myxococcales bacterium]